MIRNFHIALLVALITPIVFSTPAEAIIRRHDIDDAAYVVPAEDYPALVDLLAPGDCIATLIAPKWLITAAHCAEHFNLPGNLVIGDNTFNVLSVKLPSTWRDDLDDIALIELENEVTNVEPIGLYTGDDELGQQIWFVGRGDTNTGLQGQSGAGVDGKTRRASNTIVGVDNWWIEFVFNSPEDAAVTDLEGISGDGDSGGPALLETEDGLKIVGLSSYQDEGNFSLGTYGVGEFYTRVSRYQDWVTEHMGAANTDVTTNETPETEDDTSPDSANDTGSSTSPATDSEPDHNQNAEDCGGCSATGAQSPGIISLILFMWVLLRLVLVPKHSLTPKS